MKMNESASETKSNAEVVEKQKPTVMPGADFETAISAAGFGTFNIRLLFVSLLIIMGTVFETSTISYVLPSAECDLHLTLLDKGLLNASVYAGMITSAVLWGYLADRQGRKRSLVLGLFLGAICDFCCSASQSVIQLMVLKYFGGFLMCGPYSILMSYLSEMHGKRYRARIMMITGFMVATSTVILPLLALAILPTTLSFNIGDFKLDVIYYLFLQSYSFRVSSTNKTCPLNPHKLDHIQRYRSVVFEVFAVEFFHFFVCLVIGYIKFVLSSSLSEAIENIITLLIFRTLYILSELLIRLWVILIVISTDHTWQIFMAVAALPSLLGAVFLLFFPDSPKYHMSQGRNDKALEVLKFIYSINKKEPKESYPINQLICEVSQRETTKNIKTIAQTFDQKGSVVSSKFERRKSLRDGFAQLKPLFSKPYLRLSFQVYMINFGVLMGQNTVRLWLPQFFASINEYEHIFGRVSKMCDVVEFCVNKTVSVTMAELSHGTCEVVITPSTYMNNLIVGLTSLIGFTIVSAVINLVGTKQILMLSSFVAGTCGIGLFWSTSALASLVTASLYTTCGSIASTSIISSSVNLFPTSLRAMVISLAMMLGRSGSILGNVTFPVLMSFGCIQPFLLVSLVMFLAFVLSAFLPNTNKVSLK